MIDEKYSCWLCMNGMSMVVEEDEDDDDDGRRKKGREGEGRRREKEERKEERKKRKGKGGRREKERRRGKGKRGKGGEEDCFSNPRGGVGEKNDQRAKRAPVVFPPWKRLGERRRSTKSNLPVTIERFRLPKGQRVRCVK